MLLCILVQILLFLFSKHCIVDLSSCTCIKDLFNAVCILSEQSINQFLSVLLSEFDTLNYYHLSPRALRQREILALILDFPT